MVRITPKLRRIPTVFRFPRMNVRAEKKQFDHHVDPFSRVPEEILSCIFENLDNLSTIQQFSLTCRRFRMVAKSRRAIACWAMNRFGKRFVLYYCILSMSQRCDGPFIQQLLNMGALIPRCLLQAMLMIYGKAATSANMLPKGGSLFVDVAQQVPFSGYAMLMYAGMQHYSHIQNKEINGDLSSFLASTCHERKELIDNHAFIPAPILAPISLRSLLRYAYTDRHHYMIIAPIFEFDPSARRCLWDAVLSLLLDVAFASTPSQDLLAQLNSLDWVITPKSLAGVLLNTSDQDLFIAAFASFFAKYPVSYCTADKVENLVRLLFRHVHPSFNVSEALRHLLSVLRIELRNSVAQVLKQRDRSINVTS
ncbi:uncharacterized protein BYT42DRAFT_569938 [Radiomyces spectabilis]|uniref:uncharacterized protein n=1 Tax=Radiomyces spectabilis TaxID=64574 RepID=UPI00221F4331|nr:uncharacterized protein BYT42DRAFT_569938 [Radiomyces spectabilis]KAI8379764.1 hypothetical protein BYT42DRAFT_569938 [Radiomyces spectabilis]